MCYTTDNASPSAGGSTSSPTSFAASGSAFAQPPANSVSFFGTASEPFHKNKEPHRSFGKTVDAKDSRRSREGTTIQIRKNRKDALMAKLRQMPRGSFKKLARSDTTKTDKNKHGAKKSPCPRQVDFDASMDNLCAMFGCLSLDDSTPTKNEQRHVGLGKTVDAKKNRRSRNGKIQKSKKDALTTNLQQMPKSPKTADSKESRRSRKGKIRKNKKDAFKAKLQQMPRSPKMAGAKESRRSRRGETRKSKKDALTANLRQMPKGSLKKLAQSSTTEIDKEKDGAKNPCPWQGDFNAAIDNLCAKFGCMSLDTSTPAKNEQRHRSFGKTADTKGSRRSREETTNQRHRSFGKTADAKGSHRIREETTNQRHRSFGKTADAQDSRRSREETTNQVRKNRKDARMGKRRQVSMKAQQ